MSEERNRRVVERIWHEIVQDGDLDLIEELATEEYVYHGPGGLELHGPDGFRRLIASLHDMSETIDITVHEYITEGDRVLSRWTGEAYIPDAGGGVTWSGATITHVEDGRMAEDWEYWDRLDLAEQLVTGWFRERMVNAVSRAVGEKLPPH